MRAATFECGTHLCPSFLYFVLLYFIYLAPVITAFIVLLSFYTFSVLVLLNEADHISTAQWHIC